MAGWQGSRRGSDGLVGSRRGESTPGSIAGLVMLNVGRERLPRNTWRRLCQGLCHVASAAINIAPHWVDLAGVLTLVFLDVPFATENALEDTLRGFG